MATEMTWDWVTAAPTALPETTSITTAGRPARRRSCEREGGRLSSWRIQGSPPRRTT